MRSASPGPRVTDIRHIIGLQVDLSEPVLVTAEGLQKLKHDLEDARARRKEAGERMKEAAQPGDIEDNPEFEQAKEEVASLDNKIGRAQIIQEHHGSVAEPGSTIEVEDADGQVETWHLVGAVEADPGAGRISVESPVGRAVLGRRTGDRVTVNAPSGVIELTVKAVH